MIAIVWLLAGAVVVALWRWASTSAAHARMATVQVTLAMCAVAFNVVVPISNIEATTLVVVCAAVCLGLRSAVVVAIISVLGTDVVGGFGVWTVWQVIGFVLVAALARASRVLLRDGMREQATLALMLCVVGVGTLVYDLVVTIGTTAMLTPGADMSPHGIGALVLLGLPFTVTHIIGNLVIFVVGAPPLMRALRRAHDLMPDASEVRRRDGSRSGDSRVS